MAGTKSLFREKVEQNAPVLLFVVELYHAHFHLSLHNQKTGGLNYGGKCCAGSADCSEDQVVT